MPSGGKRPGSGRPKGSLNKTTALLKDAILKAAEKAGGRGRDGGIVGYLKTQAKINPGPFMALLGKVLPIQNVHSNPDGSPLDIKIEVTFVKPDTDRKS